MPVIHIKKHESNFVQIDKRPLSDERLSWKAKGLWAYLMSKPPDWKVYTGDLMKRSTDGDHSIRGAIKELIKYGYAERKSIRGEDGKISRWDFYVYEEPNTKIAETKPDVDFPHLANQELGNLALNKNEVSKNEKTLSSPSGDESDFDPFPGLGNEKPAQKEKPKSEYILAMERLESVFAFGRGCKLPDWENNAKAAMKRWRTPLKTIWQSYDQDTDLMARGVLAVTKQMVSDGMTFDAPDQIIKSLSSWMIDSKNGNGHSPGGAAVSNIVVAPLVDTRKTLAELQAQRS